MMLFAAFLGAVFFALAASVGVLLANAVADHITPLPDGPPPSPPPILWLVAGCAAIGAVVVAHALVLGAAPAQIAVVALVCVALVACWVCDARTGIVPDYFTLGPLAAILAVALWQRDWWLIASAAIPFVPFALAALLSRGRGMGWGDVKLVALGGALLGAQTAVLAFAVACLAAVAWSYLRGRTRGPIAFAPYLAAAIGIAIPLGVLF